MTDTPSDLAAQLGHEASRAFARSWYAEARKIEEQISDPEQRWAIQIEALRQIGWPKEDRP